jgi:hypothetical protein
MKQLPLRRQGSWKQRRWVGSQLCPIVIEDGVMRALRLSHQGQTLVAVDDAVTLQVDWTAQLIDRLMHQLALLFNTVRHRSA